MIGGLSGWEGSANVGQIVGKSLTISGISVGNRDRFLHLLAMLANADLRLLIALFLIPPAGGAPDKAPGPIGEKEHPAHS